MTTVERYSNDVRSFLATNSAEKTMEKAKGNVVLRLKDPNSADFRNVRIVNYLGGQVVCGEVNAKNSYGGYVGYAPFVASTELAELYDTDSRYPDIQAASNAGLNTACAGKTYQP